MTANPSHTAVVALGGNALSPSPGSSIHDQFRHTRQALAPIVDLAIDGWNLCIVHGNGPQVGDALLRNEMARHEVKPLPLGVLVAATAGWIGYMIQQSLEKSGVEDFEINLDSQKEANKLLDCIQRANQDVEKIQRCNERFG